MKKGLLFLGIILSTFFVGAQNAPKYSNEFLSIGVGAKALGMGNAVTASVDDVTAGYWNPAGLTGLKDNLQLSLMHSAYFAGIANYDYGAFATKLDDSRAIAFSIVRFSVDGIPNTLDLIRNGQIDYNRVSSFSASDYAFMLSYGQKTKIEGLSIGGNAKVIHRKAGEFTTAWGFGIDLGIQYQNDKGWHLGLMGRDITGTYNAWKFSFTDDEKTVFTETGNDIPKNSLEITVPQFILGVGKSIDINKNFGFKAELNGVVNTDGQRNVLLSSKYLNLDPGFGMELNYKKALFLRVGVNRFQRETDINNKKVLTLQPNFGLGLKLGSIMLDYALTDIGDVSAALYSNMFSVRFSINKKNK